jgi:membrane peptidoglycan carboxypeptidase
MSDDISASQDFNSKWAWHSTAVEWRKHIWAKIRLLPHRDVWLVAMVAVAFLATAVYELRTSALQAKLFSTIAARLSYKVNPGPSTRIVFPETGPFNETRGYAELPRFTERLMNNGFHIAAQSQFSSALGDLASWGVTPPYRPAAAAGLVIRDGHGGVIYDAPSKLRIFSSYDEIPPLIVNALLFVENRELEDASALTRNPVVDWGRSSKAALSYAGRKIGLPLPVEGGSTLATQIEKFRYGGGGRTHSASDKVLQMLNASIKVYRSGVDTRPRRREIIVDYLNSAPLAAVPGYGEVSGLRNGLYAWFGMDLDDIQAALKQPGAAGEAESAFKHVLALLCATRAPSYYLIHNRSALEARIDFYVRQLETGGAISHDFATGVREAPLAFSSRSPAP